MMQTTHIDILRHGECHGGHIFRGSTDVALLDSGLEKMRLACERRETDWDLVVSSPLRRCQEFAEKIDASPMIDKRLREMDFGEWEGKDIIAVAEQYPEQMARWRRDPEKYGPPNGEPLSAVAARVHAFYQSMLSDFRGKRILLVTHGGVIRVLLAQFLSMPIARANSFDVPYACMSKFSIYHSPDGDISKLTSHNPDHCDDKT